MTAVRRLLRHVVMDIGPLRRHRDFRLLFFGRLVTFPGSLLLPRFWRYDPRSASSSSSSASSLR